jgi:hypothetical protein
MYLLYCDETNLEPRPGDFLIYGGLMIEGVRALELSLAIDKLRSSMRVPRDYLLKFNPGPPDFHNRQFIELKQSALQMAWAHGARLIVYVVLHDIATTPDEARRNGIDTVCYHFDCVMHRHGQSGLVLVDRFKDANNLIDGHLREKFTVGVTGMPYSKEIRLKNVVGFHYSAIGQSHFPSLVDIALGSLRFAVNAHTRGNERDLPTARALMSQLSPLIWREAGVATASELGFAFRPKFVQVRSYRERYTKLKDFLDAGGIKVSQEITDQRHY